MIHASDRVANMDVHLRSQISLPLRRELPQIMPQSSKIPPIASCSCLCRAGRKHLTSKLRTPVSDLVQMSMISIQPSTFFAILLLALIDPISERSKERFPLRFRGRPTIFIFKSVGVNGHLRKKCKFYVNSSQET